MRPRALEDPEPQVVDAVLACRDAGPPSVATKLLAAPASEGVHSSRFLTASALEARKKEVEEESRQGALGETAGKSGTPLAAAGACGAPLGPAGEQAQGTAGDGHVLGVVLFVRNGRGRRGGRRNFLEVARALRHVARCVSPMMAGFEDFHTDSERASMRASPQHPVFFAIVAVQPLHSPSQACPQQRAVRFFLR